MENIFDKIRYMTDKDGELLNFQRDRFFSTLHSEHSAAYKQVEPKLFSLTKISDKVEIDLSSLGLSIDYREKFIYPNKKIIKNIIFYCSSSFDDNFIELLNIYINKDGQVGFSETKTCNFEELQYPVLVQSQRLYDEFFERLFTSLARNELIVI
ncbi:hypothetical protein [Citrobacter sp. wls712]|uniref:hypothetical protein n=1 Tax=Citrobacter sp. wls712 TaxID=2576424 RepID=UPI0010C974A0|nr:hypothetical protein [Citrobacter sp. wls712]TKU54836.1 hypothetical protein FDX08_06610 [Citrobacter sp. wls712]